MRKTHKLTPLKLETLIKKFKMWTEQKLYFLINTIVLQ